VSRGFTTLTSSYKANRNDGILTKMTALAAALSDGEHDVKTLVDSMLSVMKHRGLDQRIIQCTRRLSLGGRYPIGQQRLFQAKGRTAGLDGAFFGKSERGQARIAISLPKKRSEEYATLRGAYSALVASDGACNAVRDPIGLKPLYYSKKSRLIAIASRLYTHVEKTDQETFAASPTPS
jgi:hypothetical protein